MTNLTEILCAEQVERPWTNLQERSFLIHKRPNLNEKVKFKAKNFRSKKRINPENKHANSQNAAWPR